jgi:hypothetical protein
MKSENFDPKIIIASALIGTSLFATSPIIRKDLSRVENNISSTKQKEAVKLEEHVYKHKFQCSQTGLIIHFLPNFKAQLFSVNINQALQGDYRVQFNRDIVMNVYNNPSKSFNFILRDVAIQTQGFNTNINSKEHYFQKV